MRCDTLASELWDALRAIGRAEQGTIAALAALGGLVGVRGRAPERGTIAALVALGGLVDGEGKRRSGGL